MGKRDDVITNVLPGALRVFVVLSLTTLTSHPLLAQEKPSPKSYLQQLEVTSAEQQRGYQSFVTDVERLDRRPRQPGNLEVAEAEGGIHQPLKNPEEIRATDGILQHNLTIEYGDNLIYNVKQGKNVKVHLRSYNGRLFGKTLRIKPGELLKVLVDNQLPPDKPYNGDINIPHRFNTTNLHTHGLHVSPAGNSDNVLLAIPPKKTFQNEIYIPADHTGGTFWYHAHVHGSTAIQTTSGMAGAILIEGGLDNAPGVKDALDRIMIFQQMPYVESKQTADVYEIESYDDLGDWNQGVNQKGWRTTINGQTQPIIDIQPQEVQRWRLIHASLRETIDVSIVPYDQALEMMEQYASRLEQADKAPEAELLQETRLAAVEERRETVLRKAVPLNEIAADGLAYGFLWPRDSVDLQPGYRSDVLVKIDEPGLYVLMDNEVAEEAALWRSYESPKVLGFVRVGGPAKPMALPTNAELARYRPYESIKDEEIVEHTVAPSGQMMTKKRLQKVEFNIDLDFNPVLFQINSQTYDPKAPPRTMELGTAQEWILTSRLANHPFHIHVNPFEIVQWNDAKGNSRLPVIDGERRTIWKDTILVMENKDDSEPKKIRARSRNERYIGRFVLHCHILDHEDQGMMQDVEIVPPGSAHH